VIAALFDIEGTLYTNPMGRGFLRYASANGRKLRALLYYGSLMPRYYLAKLGVTSKETLHRTAIARMPLLIQGRHPAGWAAFDWVANSFIPPSGGISQHWDHHRRLGRLLVIAGAWPHA
jgi:hypothetical protein